MAFNWSDWGNTISNIGGAVLDFFGRQEDRKSQEEINAQNLEVAKANIAAQKEYAQMGVRWRVEDAVAAGLHPLAALGANTPMYSPVMPLLNPVPSTAGNVYKSLSALGQNVQRSIEQMQTKEERELEKLKLRNAELQNDFLEAQVAGARLENVKHAQGPGMPSSFQMMKNADGTISIQPSSEWAQANSGNLISPLWWMLKNKFIPALGLGGAEGYPNAVDENGKLYKYMPGAGAYYEAPGGFGPWTYKTQ